MKTITANIPGRTAKSPSGKVFKIEPRTDVFTCDDNGRWALEGAGAVLESEVIDVCRKATNWPAIRAEHFAMEGFCS